MAIKRREFLKTTTIAAGAALAAPEVIAQGQTAAGRLKDTPISQLKRMTDGIVPITTEERLARQEKARRLMVENKIDAVVIEGSTTLNYFTAVSWGLSERTFVWVLPARGEMAWVSPKFEEDRALELIKFGSDVRTWEEDESPYKVIAKTLADRGLRSGRIGIDERLRFFIYDGLRQAAPGLEFASADPVTIGCRSIKSAAEIALMQRANDITVEAYKAALAMLKGSGPASASNRPSRTARSSRARSARATSFSWTAAVGSKAIGPTSAGRLFSANPRRSSARCGNSSRKPNSRHLPRPSPERRTSRLI
jgi:Xaa-Pro dipeptidase